MAGLSDILTTAKNIATAINNAAQTYLNVQGALSYANLTTASVIHMGAGRVCNVVVTVAGSAPGSICDSNNTSSTTNVVFVIPNTLGVYTVNFPVSTGVLVVPGYGQTVAVSHS